VSTPFPEELRQRIRREVEEGTRPVVHLRRDSGDRPQP